MSAAARARDKLASVDKTLASATAALHSNAPLPVDPAIPLERFTWDATRAVYVNPSAGYIFNPRTSVFTNVATRKEYIYDTGAALYRPRFGADASADAIAETPLKDLLSGGLPMLQQEFSARTEAISSLIGQLARRFTPRKQGYGSSDDAPAEADAHDHAPPPSSAAAVSSAAVPAATAAASVAPRPATAGTRAPPTTSTKPARLGANSAAQPARVRAAPAPRLARPGRRARPKLARVSGCSSGRSSYACGTPASSSVAAPDSGRGAPPTAYGSAAMPGGYPPDHLPLPSERSGYGGGYGGGESECADAGDGLVHELEAARAALKTLKGRHAKELDAVRRGWTARCDELTTTVARLRAQLAASSVAGGAGGWRRRRRRRRRRRSQPRW